MGLLGSAWKNKDKIMEGIRNKIMPPKELKDLIHKTVVERKLICYVCPFMSKNAQIHFNYKSQRFDDHCTKCGCNIDLKASSLSSECPDNPPRWNSVVSEDEFSNIEQTMKDYEESSSQEHQDKTITGDTKEL